MVEVPQFRVFGHDDPNFRELIQPRLDLRHWSDLERSERVIAARELVNSGWVKGNSHEILRTIEHLNQEFLRECPGKQLHKIVPIYGARSVSNERERMEAAHSDFLAILLDGKSDPLTLRMLTVLAGSHIDYQSLRSAKDTKGKKKREEYIELAFKTFDRFARCLNHIFSQFSINMKLTRSGLVPLQDEKIVTQIYEPVLRILADPKWQSVNVDLSQMLSAYHNQDFAEVVTHAHRSVQRFLQILVGDEGKSGRGEVGKLFAIAKKTGAIPVNRFSESIINSIQAHMVSERATKSTAKPAVVATTQSDALLMMNVVMIFLQHCLVSEK